MNASPCNPDSEATRESSPTRPLVTTTPTLRQTALTPVLAASAVTCLTFLFASFQNRVGWVGGPISLAKTLWLNFTLLVFLVLPLCLWRNQRLAPHVRVLFGVVFVSFALRGVAELYILYFTHAWECIYGIGHDLLTFAAIVWCRRRSAVKHLPHDQRALAFATLVQVALLVEGFMAWQFSRLASPADGIYFADDNAHFRFVNNASWVAAALGYPLLGQFLWRTRHDFSFYENQKTPESGGAGGSAHGGANLPIV